MKRFVSLLLVVSLTLSLALVLGACGGSEDVDATTDSISALDEETTGKLFIEGFHVIENGTERETGEHYSEEYEKLTLPAEVPTTKATSTTQKNDTKVTTTRQSVITTTQATTATTKKETTTKKTESTSEFVINTDFFSQTEVFTEIVDNIQDEYVGFGSGVTPSEVPRPEVTYADKYIADVLRSQNYTMTTQMSEGGQGVSYTEYIDGSRGAVKGELQVGGVAMSFRIFEKNSKIYMVIPSFFSYIEMDELDDQLEGLDEAMAEVHQLIYNQNLQYCGMSSGVGYICEMYKDAENDLGFNYYFDSNGLTKIESVVLSKNERMTYMVSLKQGISEKGVFDIPAGYKKTDFDSLGQSIEGMGQ